jgi:hypothetical protein
MSKPGYTARHTARHRTLTVLAAALFAIGTVAGSAHAQKATTPKSQDRLALGEEQIKQLLVLMDTDKNGKISKQEFMRFMEAEFKRLDVDKNGQLDVKALTQSKPQTSQFGKVGK